MFKKFIKIAVLFFSFLSITGLFTYLTMDFFIKNEKSVVVPDLLDKDVINTLELLTALKLNTKVKGSEYSPTIPRNRVISQQPEPGTIIKTGRDVKIVFSRGPRKVTLPDVRQIPLREAAIILEKSGIATGSMAYASDKSIARESIISQYPFPGSRVQRGDKVNLLVSSGRKTVYYKMADLTNMLLDEAIMTIEKNNLKLGKISSSPVRNRAENAVSEHQPSAGSRVALGSTVDLVINRPETTGQAGFQRGHTGVRVFRHTIEIGFIKKHIKVQLNSGGNVTGLFDGYARPGEELWFLVPLYTNATLFLYEDGQLIETRFFD